MLLAMMEICVLKIIVILHWAVSIPPSLFLKMIVTSVTSPIVILKSVLFLPTLTVKTTTLVPGTTVILPTVVLTTNMDVMISLLAPLIPAIPPKAANTNTSHVMIMMLVPLTGAIGSMDVFTPK